MARVLLENVTKVFDGKITAVNNITLDVADQELMVIVGPSGCGKTTTLRMIAGLEDVTSGTIAIGDRIVNDLPPRDRNIAMVFQNYALYPHMTVFQNMAFGLKFRKYPKEEIKKRVVRTAKLLGIEELLDRKPRALSGGQRQRVAVGRAIVRNPKAFLFDEPLSNLDAKLRVTTRAELKSLHRRLQATTIHVTHDQVEAMTLGDRICVMYKGVVQHVAPPMEVYNRPVNKFVASFFGMPPMNFFDGHVEFEQNVPQFVVGNTAIILSEGLRDNLRSYKSKEMVLGVRPEHISPVAIEGQSRNGIPATVDVVEPLGDCIAVCLTSEFDKQFTAKMSPRLTTNVGETLTMYIDASQVHIFEPGEMGRNISLAT